MTDPVQTPSPEPSPTPAPTPSDPPSLVNPTAPAVDPNATPAEPAKPAEPAPAPEPLTWDKVTVPEGIQIDEAIRDEALGIFNDDKLSPAERMSKLVDLQGRMANAWAENNYKAWTDQQTAWQEEVRADPEIGGEKLAPTLGEISKLIDQYGTPEVRQIMDSTGAGNNLHVIRMMSKIAKDLGEGGPVLGAPSAERESLPDRLYPSMKKQGA